jgi:hypothetical protein
VRILTNPSFGFCVKAKFEALDHHRRRACLLVALAFLGASSLVVEAGDRREGGREGRGGGGWIRCCCCWSGAESKIQIGERTLGRSVAPRGACSKKLVRNPKGAFSEACFSFYKRKDFPGVQGQRIREKTVSLWVGLSSDSKQQASVSLQPARERERERERERTLIPPLGLNPTRNKKTLR